MASERKGGRIGQTLLERLGLPAGKNLELIIGYEDSRLEEILNGLLKDADLVHLYREIPYLAIRCSKGYAEALCNGTSGVSASSMMSIDLSHDISTSAFSGFSEHTGHTEHTWAGAQWNLERVGIPAAWDYATGEGVSVAVLDTGVEYDHPALRDRFGDLLGYNVEDPSRPPRDGNGHGTHVAGTIAGRETGVAPGATLYAVKVLDDSGCGSEADVIAGIEWALEQGCDIVNMSLGSRGASRAFQRICDRAYREGMYLVAAAGNEERGPSYPASFGESVIAVAATDRNDNHAWFSNIYSSNDISAPGVNIRSTYLRRGHNTLSGTSMAAPHVAGALALGCELSREADLEGRMKESAQELQWRGKDSYRDVFGAGLLRADRMLEALSAANEGGSDGRSKIGRLLR